jgi:hypothetical protein
MDVMALAGVPPSDRTTALLLEREAEVAGLQAGADAAREGGGRRRPWDGAHDGANDRGGYSCPSIRPGQP